VCDEFNQTEMILRIERMNRKFKGMHIGIAIEGFMVMLDFKNHHESCSWSGICKYMYLVIISQD
jgi:hypothetical protein